MTWSWKQTGSSCASPQDTWSHTHNTHVWGNNKHIHQKSSQDRATLEWDNHWRQDCYIHADNQKQSSWSSNQSMKHQWQITMNSETNNQRHRRDWPKQGTSLKITYSNKGKQGLNMPYLVLKAAIPAASSHGCCCLKWCKARDWGSRLAAQARHRSTIPE